MRLLIASTLLLLATSNLVAFEVVPPAPNQIRRAPLAVPEQPAADLFVPLSLLGANATNRFQAQEPVPAPAGNTNAADGIDDNETRAVSTETICETVASAAAAHDLPAIFFLRLIWQESRFDPWAISRAGAQGVAQFMPRVAAAMGLTDPFDPAQALPKSARFLRELREQFGNLGLAAAAYNAGSGRIQDWLAKRGKLPQETRNYVMNITGHAPEHWAKVGPSNVRFKVPPRVPCQLPESAVASIGNVPLPPERPNDLQSSAPDAIQPTIEATRKSQARLPAAHGADVVRVTGTGTKVEIVKVAAAGATRFRATIPMRTAAATPPRARASIVDRASASATRLRTAKAQPAETWGVQLAAHWSESKAMQGFDAIRKKHGKLLANRKPIVVGSKLGAKGATLKRVQIAMNTRAGAEQLCSQLKSAGGACVVLRN